VSLWNYIWLPAKDGFILVYTGLRCYTGTVHCIAPSLHESPLAVERLLQSLHVTLLDNLLERQHESLVGSLIERAEHREEKRFPPEAFGRWQNPSLWKL
jgi:hypothetical protein